MRLCGYACLLLEEAMRTELQMDSSSGSEREVGAYRNQFNSSIKLLLFLFGRGGILEEK